MYPAAICGTSDGGGSALVYSAAALPKIQKCGLVQPLQVVYFSIYGGLFVGSGLIGMLGLKRGERLLLPASLLACNNRLAPFNTPLGGHVPRAGGPFIIVIKPAPSDPNNPTILRMPILARALFSTRPPAESVRVKLGYSAILANGHHPFCGHLTPTTELFESAGCLPAV